MSPTHGHDVPLDELLGGADPGIDLLDLGHQVYDAQILLLQLFDHREVGVGLFSRLGGGGVNEGDHLLLRVYLGLDLPRGDHLEEGGLEGFGVPLGPRLLPVGSSIHLGILDGQISVCELDKAQLEWLTVHFGHLLDQTPIPVGPEPFLLVGEFLLKNLRVVPGQEGLTKREVGEACLLQGLLQHLVEILGQQLLNMGSRLARGYLPRRHLDECQQDQLLVALRVHLVKNLCGVGQDQAELLTGICVPLQTHKYKPLVVQVTENIHGLCGLLEGDCGPLDDLQGVLVALGLDAQLRELLVEGAAHRIGIHTR
jgi:hypothetical protein